MKTYNIMDWDYVKHDNFQRPIQAKEFSLPQYPQIRLIAEKKQSGWMIYESTTGFAVCAFERWKTRADALSAVHDNFKRYGQDKIVSIIQSKQIINL